MRGCDFPSCEKHTTLSPLLTAGACVPTFTVTIGAAVLQNQHSLVLEVSHRSMCIQTQGCVCLIRHQADPRICAVTRVMAQMQPVTNRQKEIRTISSSLQQEIDRVTFNYFCCPTKGALLSTFFNSLGSF